MVLNYSNLRFLIFSVLFVSVATSAAFFIFPLLLISFICSGFVLFFTGLSYGSFRVASSQYNHTVLFLNKVLRKIADSIPPSVGYSEIKPINIDSSSFFKTVPKIPNLGITSFFKRLVLLPFNILSFFNPFSYGKLKFAKTKVVEPIVLEEVAQEEEELQVQVIHDEDENILDAYLDKSTVEETKPDTLIVGEVAPIEAVAVVDLELDPVKVSEPVA